MSRTTKHFGKPEGHATRPPEHFSDPGQQTERPAGYGGNHRPPTSAPRTITAGGNTADGNVKSSAEPCVKVPPGSQWHACGGGENGYAANKGK